MTAVLCLSPAALATARRVRAALPDAALHAPAHRVPDADHPVSDAMADHARALFAAGTPLVGVCASGILVRWLAPALADKTAEPPVLAVAADGSAVVPLLGGHHGANALARTLADALDAPAAVTTGSDAALGVALDDPPPGWHAGAGDPGAVMARALAGEAVRLEGDAPWLEDSGLPLDAGADTVITVSERADAAGDLVYYPETLAVGVGASRDCPADEMTALVDAVLRDAGLAPAAVAGVYSVDAKADEPAVHAAARHLARPARFFDAATLAAGEDRLATPSEVVREAVGCPGVAEGAALAAAGPEAVLAVAKRTSANATCAVARAPAPFDGAAAGRPQGRLAVVGLGPGRPAHVTPAASAALARADTVVGYRLYLDLVDPAVLTGKRVEPFAMGAETERCRRALEAAAEGRDVALVCSGDPGIYAMAALVFELWPDVPAAARVTIHVEPGLSALQMAAARAGAPLGHDFCAVSLSDLMTPWPVIEQRLRAAAEGDFVTALYNPVSKKRRDHLPRARDLFLEHRPPDTPVVVARNLGRDGETVRSTRLDALAADDADMLTVLLVGSSATRLAGDHVYTPRGYATKNAEETTP